MGRAIAGLGGAGLIIGNITIIASCAPVGKRPAYMGVTMGLSSVGLVAGPVSRRRGVKTPDWGVIHGLSIRLGEEKKLNLESLVP